MKTTSQINQTERSHYSHLDSMRAFAALAVFAYHCKTEFHISNYFFLKPIFVKGYLGVILFYILSGFVIFCSLDRLMAKSHSSFKNLLKEFWVRRFMRIYPLYIFSIAAVYWLDSSVRKYLDMPNLLSHLTGLHSMFREYHGSINGVLWTLSLEMQFYFIAPFLFLLLRRIGNYSLLATGILIWGLSYFISRMLMIERFAMWGTGTPDRIDSWSYFMGLNQLPNVLVYFLLGYLAYRKRSEAINGSWIAVPAAILILSYFESSIMSFLAPLCDFYCFNYILQLIYASGFYILIRLVTRPNVRENIFGIFQPVLEWLGQISYGLYIWHLLVIRFVQQIMPHTSNTHNILVSLIFTIILADFSYRHIESRFINLGRKLN